MFIPLNFSKMIRKQCGLYLLICVIGIFALFQLLATVLQSSGTEPMDSRLTGRVPKAFYIAEESNYTSYSDKWPNVTRLQSEIENYLSKTEKTLYKFPWTFKFQDNRDKSCNEFESKSYIPKNSVSIIIAVGNAPLVQVLSSVMYILYNTHSPLVYNIIIIGDSRLSENEFEILEELLHPVPFFRTFRLPNVTSELGAAYFASKFSQASYFVMMNAKVLVTSGWLEPLVYTLRNEYRNVAIPNVILSENETEKETDLSHSRRRELDLDLELKWGYKGPDAKSIIRNPTVYENLFLVSEKYFEELGGFDDVRAASGAEAVLWSLKTWMCRGQILLSPCSRVFETKLIERKPGLDRSKILKHKLYIARTLMGSDQNSYLCLSSVFPRTSNTRGSSRALYFSGRARNFYQNSLKCSNFKTFLTIAQPGFHVRPQNTEFFGKLQVKDTEIFLTPDKKLTKLILVGNNTQMGRNFKFDSNNFMYGTKCIDFHNNELVLSRCTNLNASKTWTYQNHVFKLKNNPNNCLTHEVDPQGQTLGTLKMLPCSAKYRKHNQLVFSLQYAKNCV